MSNSIKIQVSLNKEQKRIKDIILKNTVTVLTGKPGSGKTFLACQTALSLLSKKSIEKIIITRPTVSDENLGFLPGDISEKMEPWLQPIYQNMYMISGEKQKIKGLIEEGKIEILPLSFTRGVTFVKSFVILDEAQNVTNKQMKMFLSRIGKNSKVVVCGDTEQVDLKSKSESGLSFVSSLKDRVSELDHFELKTNHRHEIVDDLMEIYNQNNIK